MAHKDLDRAFGVERGGRDGILMKYMQGMSTAERFVYVVLCNCRNEKHGGLCYPTIDHIVGLTGLGTRTVKRAIRSLAEADLIQVYVVEHGKYRKNYYALTARKSSIPNDAVKVAYGSEQHAKRFGPKKSHPDKSHTETSTSATQAPEVVPQGHQTLSSLAPKLGTETGKEETGNELVNCGAFAPQSEPEGSPLIEDEDTGNTASAALAPEDIADWVESDEAKPSLTAHGMDFLKALAQEASHE